MPTRNLDPYTLRWASVCARKGATMARRLQMMAPPESKPFMRNKANALDGLADTLRRKAQAIEATQPRAQSRAKKAGGK